MIVEYESIDFGEAIPVKCFIHQMGNTDWHWHESMEIMFFLEGTTNVTVNEVTYTFESGDIVLINSYEPHVVETDDSLVMVVQIDLNRFDKQISGGSSARFLCNTRIYENEEGYEHLRIFLAQFIQIYTTDDVARMARAKSIAYGILAELQLYFRAPDEEQTYNQQAYIRLNSLVHYINEHFTEDISMKELAAKWYLSVPYFSSFFHKYMHITFREYVNRVRLDHALNLLLSTNDTMEIISEKSGFPNPRTFSRVFQEVYGLLPSQYRKMHKENSAEQLRRITAAASEYTIVDPGKYLDIFSKYIKQKEFTTTPDTTCRNSVKQRIDADVTKEVTHLQHLHRTMMSVASAKDLLMKNVQEMVLRTQQEIGYQYINFHGLLSDDMHVCFRGRNGKLIFSFTYIDAVLDFICDAGLKPFIQLSFMPEVLAKYPDRRIFQTSMINSIPDHMKEWIALVIALYKHLKNRYGEEAVSSWPFVIWNEPDTPITMFGFDRLDEFYEFYKSTYETLHELSSRIQIGGPATFIHTEDDALWIKRFCRWAAENNCFPDFLMFHYYGTQFVKKANWIHDATSKRMMLSTDENAFSSCVSKIKDIVREMKAKVPVYISEWNFTPSHADLLNDTCFSACYYVKSILENYDSLNAFCHWMLTDLCDENPVPDMLYHGGMGIFTVNGIPKPIYYAGTFLARLGNEMLSKGDGFFITRKGDGYVIILYHYAHYSDLYAQGEMLDMTITRRDTPFAAAENKSVQICLKGMENGTWLVTEHIINSKSGSSYDLWADNGAWLLRNSDDYQNLSARSVPNLKRYELEVDNHYLTVSADMEPLEIRCLEICRNEEV